MKARRDMPVLLDALGVPIRPEEPNELRKLILVAQLLSRPARMFVTATRWAAIAREVREFHKDDLAQPWNLPNRDNFQRLKIGRLEVVNAGIEDEEAVNTANWLEVPPDFRSRAEALRAGRGGRVVPESEPVNA